MSASERSNCLLPPRRAMRNQEKSPSEDRLQLFSLHTFSPPRLTRAFMSASERLIPIMHMPSMPRSMPSLLEDSKRSTLTPSLLDLDRTAISTMSMLKETPMFQAARENSPSTLLNPRNVLPSLMSEGNTFLGFKRVVGEFSLAA